jgi:hypothetical protein
LNELFFGGEARLAAVDPRQRVDLAVQDAEVAEVVAGLLAIDLVRLDP